MRTIKRINDYLITLFYLLLGSAGIMGMVLSVIEPEIHLDGYIVGSLMTCAAMSFLLVCLKHKHTLILTVGFLPCYLILCYWNADRMAGSITNGLQRLIVHINRRFDIHYVLTQRPEYGISDTTFSFLMITIPIVVLFGIAVRYAGMRILAVCFLLVLIAALWIDKMPDLEWILCALLCYLGIQAGGKRMKGEDTVSSNTDGECQRRFVCFLKRKKRRKPIAGIEVKAAVGSFLLAGITAILAGLVLPCAITYLNEPYLQAGIKIQSTVNDEILPSIVRVLQSNNLFSTGAANGELNHNGGFGYVGAKLMEVVAEQKPEHDIYLKGFIGSTYHADIWEAENQTDLSDYYKEKGWEIENGRDVMNLSYYAAGNIAIFDPIKRMELEIRRLNISDKYDLYPYGAYLSTEKIVQLDGTLKGDKNKVSSYHYYPIQEYYLFGKDNQIDLGKKHSSEYHYREYVYHAYLEVPDKGLEQLIANYQSRADLDIWSNLYFVAETLPTLATYNINVPPCPEGEDFVEHFLFEQKEGYCVHFASTAVLMLRIMGIPARYVSGYCVPADSFQAMPDGSYQAIVEDRQAHAWAEVYLEGIGWMPLETTPSGGTSGNRNFLLEDLKKQQEENSELDPQQSMLEDKNKNDLQEEPVKDSEEDNKSEKEKQTQNNAERSQDNTLTYQNTNWKILAMILATLALFAAGFGCLWICRIYIQKQRYQKFSAPDFRERIRYIFLEMYEIMIYAGLSNQLEVSDSDFTYEVMTLCPRVQEQEFKNFIKLVEQCNFSSRQPSAEELQKALMLYHKISEDVLHRLNRRKRMILRLKKAL